MGTTPSRPVPFWRANDDIHVTPGYGLWKPLNHGLDSAWRLAQDSSLWKRLRFSLGLARYDDDDEMMSYPVINVPVSLYKLMPVLHYTLYSIRNN